MKLMKGGALVLLIGMVMQANAEEPVLAEGMMSIGIPVFVEDRNTYVLTGKRMISADAAVVIGAGLIADNNRRNSVASSIEGTFQSGDKSKDKAYYLSGGYRKYVDRDWLNTYWESSGHLSYFETKGGAQSCGSSCFSDNSTTRYRSIGATIRFGGEHFISQHFSIEGSAGVTLNYWSTRQSGSQDGQMQSSHKTFNDRISSNFSSLNLNYYWK